jgi:hypothetical protein
MKTRDKILKILERSQEARNSDIALHKEFLMDHICNSAMEREIIRRVFGRLKTNLASVTRARAYIQNKLELHKSDEQIQKLRDEEEERKREEYSPINNGTRY